MRRWKGATFSEILAREITRQGPTGSELAQALSYYPITSSLYRYELYIGIQSLLLIILGPSGSCIPIRRLPNFSCHLLLPCMNTPRQEDLIKTRPMEPSNGFSHRPSTRLKLKKGRNLAGPVAPRIRATTAGSTKNLPAFLQTQSSSWLR